MRANLRKDLTAALGARDRVAITALRSALSAIDNAEALGTDDQSPATAGSEHVAGAAIGVGAGEAARRRLTDSDVRSIVQAEVDERIAAAEEYERLGRNDAADKLRSEAAVLNRHLAK